MAWSNYYNGTYVGGETKRQSLKSSAERFGEADDTYIMYVPGKTYIVDFYHYCNNSSQKNDCGLSLVAYDHTIGANIPYDEAYPMREHEFRFDDYTYGNGDRCPTSDSDESGYTNAHKTYVIHGWEGVGPEKYKVLHSGEDLDNVTSNGYYGYNYANNNNWVHLKNEYYKTDYYAITVINNSFLNYTFRQVYAGCTYSINMATYSENGYDGIMISTQTLSSSQTISNFTSSTNGYVGKCTGTNANAYVSYTPSSNGYLYIYYKTDSSTLSFKSTASLGEVSIYLASGTEGGGGGSSNPVITLNKNGGSGGTDSVTVPTGASGSYVSITNPTRSGYNNLSYTFLGYYTSPSGGTQYINSSGDGSRTFDFTSNTTLYAHWRNNMSVSVDTNYPEIYCTTSATAASVTTGGTQYKSLFDYNPYSSSGSLSYDITSDTGKIGMSTPEEIKIYDGLSAGTYRFKVYLTAPSYSGANGYEESTWVDVFYLTVNPVVLSSITASISTKNVNVGSATPQITVTATYTNGATKTISGSASYSWSTSGIATVTLSASGDIAYVVGVSPGTVNLTISYTDGGVTKTTSISGITVNKLSHPAWSLSSNNVTLYSITSNGTGNPSGYTYHTYDIVVTGGIGTLTYTCSSTDYMTVTKKNSTTFTVTFKSAYQYTSPAGKIYIYDPGNSTYSSSDKTCYVYCKADTVKSLSTSTSTSSISYGGTATISVTATYESGYSTDVTSGSTYSTSPTGIVTIS